MMVRWSDEVQGGSNLKSVLSLTSVDVKLVFTFVVDTPLVNIRLHRAACPGLTPELDH